MKGAVVGYVHLCALTAQHTSVGAAHHTEQYNQRTTEHLPKAQGRKIRFNIDGTFLLI